MRLGGADDAHVAAGGVLLHVDRVDGVPRSCTDASWTRPTSHEHGCDCETHHSHRITQWSHEGSQSGSVTVAVLMPLGGTVGSSIPASPAQPTKFLSLIQRFGVSSRSVSYEMYRAQSPGWFACRYHSTASGAPAVIVSVGAAAALMSWHAKASSECCMPDATSGAKKVNGWLACWKLCGWAQQKEPGLRLDASQTIPSTQNASRADGLVLAEEAGVKRPPAEVRSRESGRGAHVAMRVGCGHGDQQAEPSNKG